MIMLRRYSIGVMVVIGLFLMMPIATAQDETTATNGRFCIRMFEDANGNGAQETGEAPITQGIGADLRPLNSEIVIASQLIQDAPNRRAGEICFGDLQLGLYEITVSSATYDVPAADNTVFTRLSEIQPVIIASYGVPARSVQLTDINADDEVDREAVLEKSLVAGAGSLIAMAITAFIGIIIYVIFLRKPNAEPVAPYYASPSPDDRYRPPPPPAATDTSEVRQTDKIDYNYQPPE